METRELIEALSCPEAWPHSFRDFEVHQTHISVVFLVDRWAYKVKKPRDLGFLDFTTLEKRWRYCREEVRLNRRLAHDVYRGVVAIVEGKDGLRVAEDAQAAGGPGDGRRVPDAEPAVKMRRLPAEARLLARLERGELRPGHLRALARRLARFHADAAAGPRVSRFGRYDVVASNARENLEQSEPHVGTTLSREVHERLSARLEQRLDSLRGLIESRAAAGVPRDTHGDLHLDHVYRFPDRTPPHDLVVIDCIEFNERFRYADPVADVAFLSMDLRYRGRADLARGLENAWIGASSDGEAWRLFPFYVSYRAAVRGKVEGMAALAEEVEEEDRRKAVERARAYWLLALGALESPVARPALLLVGGLPGTGKSTLGAGLAEAAGFSVLSSDVTRKQLAGVDPDASAAAGFGEGLYSEEWNERTYGALAERASEALFRGERVLLDASFRAEAERRRLLAVADRLGVPALFLLCDAPSSVVHDRLRRPGRRGGSDAGMEVYERAAEVWDPPDPDTAGSLRPVDTGHPAEDESVRQALSHLRKAGLF